MIEVEWSPEASEDLELLLSYIAADSAQAANVVGHRIRLAERAIALFPRAGRSDSASGAWERLVNGVPLFLIYALDGDRARIIALFHTARSPASKRTIR